MASLVVFEDGVPRKSDYRLYRIRDAAGDGHSDDVGSIAEVTRRRFRRHHEDPALTPDETDGPVDDEADADAGARAGRRFAYPPQLFVVDGGRPQVEAAAGELSELGVTDVPVIGIAKRLEEIWLPGEEYPVIFPRHGEGLFLSNACATRHTGSRSAPIAELRSADDGLRARRRPDSVQSTRPDRGVLTISALRRATTEELCAVPGSAPRWLRRSIGARVGTQNLHDRPGMTDSGRRQPG